MRFWTWVFRTFARKRSSEAQARTGRSYHLAADRKSRDEAGACEFVLEIRSVQQPVSVIPEFRLCEPRGNSRWSVLSRACLHAGTPCLLRALKQVPAWAVGTRIAEAPTWKSKNASWSWSSKMNLSC